MTEREIIDCPACDGHGLVKAQDATGKWHVYECRECRGYGWVYGRVVGEVMRKQEEWVGKDIRENEIIQIAPPHKWGGCLAVVSEVKSFGCQAYVSIPHNDETPPGHAYIRLSWKDFERVGADVIFAPADHVDT